MYNVIGVRFKKAGKIYYFDPNGFDIEQDSCVIVETVRGVEYGQVVIANKQVDEHDVVLPLRKVIRVADERDLLIVEENKQEALSAFEVCQKKVADHGLDMKLVDVEFTFDRNKVIFTLRQTDGLISGNWSKTWLLSLKRESNCAKSG